MTRQWVLALGLLLTTVSTAFAQEPPCVFPRRDGVNARVRVKVSKSVNGFDYHYMLTNGSGAQQVLIKFAVQVLNADGSLLTQTSPPNWEAGGRIADTMFFVWDTFENPRGLVASASVTGLGFKEADLPAIVTFLAWGDVKRPTFPEGEAPESCENTDIIENSFKGKTVGPKPPPQDFVPIEFLNYLITLVHDSRQLGWIRETDEQRKLLRRLQMAKRRLEKNEPGKAAANLRHFLKEVDKEGCRDFRCPRGKALTSETFALLFFNGQHLFERLPQPREDEDDDRDEDDDKDGDRKQ